MGFYVRKGFNFGPLRLNLSRSGLGASVGVKGARIGVGPRGNYVHVGRGGLYYRQTLPPGQSGNGSPAAPVTQPNIAFEEIASTARAVDMVDESASQLLQELNRVKRRVDLFPATLIVGLAGLLYCIYLMSIGWWVAFLGVIGFPLIAFYARHLDVTNGTAILQYSLEPDAERRFQDFRAAFEKVSNCRAVWHVDASGQTNDWKRKCWSGFYLETFRRAAIGDTPTESSMQLCSPGAWKGWAVLLLLSRPTANLRFIWRRRGVVWSATGGLRRNAVCGRWSSPGGCSFRWDDMAICEQNWQP
jgi:hypothetical protein